METSFLPPSFHQLAPPVSPPQVIGIIMIKPRATFFHSLISRRGKLHPSSFVPCQRGSKFPVFFPVSRPQTCPSLSFPLSSWTLLQSWSNRKLQSFHRYQSEVRTAGRKQQSLERITIHDFCFVSFSVYDDHTWRNWRGRVKLTNDKSVCVCVCVSARENWRFRGDKFSWEGSHSKPSWNLRNDL